MRASALPGIAGIGSTFCTVRCTDCTGPLQRSYAARQLRIEANSDLLAGLEQLWERHLRMTPAEMPQIEIDLDTLV